MHKWGGSGLAQELVVATLWMGQEREEMVSPESHQEMLPSNAKEVVLTTVQMLRSPEYEVSPRR